MFYVYKFKGRYGDYPNNWKFSSKHETYDDARKAAEALCPKGLDIYTEPGHDLPGPGYFGGHGRELWHSMIDTKDIHAASAA